MILNDSRVPVQCEYVVWLRNVNGSLRSRKRHCGGGKTRSDPVQTMLPKRLKKGRCELAAQVVFREKTSGNELNTAIALDVIPKPEVRDSGVMVAL